MTSFATASARAEMNELRRLKTLLPPELQSWVIVEATTEVNPPIIRSEEIGRDEVEIQIDLGKWENLSLDQRNLMFWHEVARIQNDTIPKEGWEMAALAIGLGGAVGELWVQDGLLLILALGLCGVSGYRLWQKNNGNKTIQAVIDADEKAIALATRFGYSVPNAYKSLGSALKTLIEQTPNRRARKTYETRLQALRKSASKAKARMQTEQKGESAASETEEEPPSQPTPKRSRPQAKRKDLQR
ncbi:MAG: DUF3318 domain-containing protein [Halothece sp.]